MVALTPQEWSAVKISLTVASSAVALSLPLGVALAYLLARKRFVGKSMVETFFDLSLVLPPVVVGYLLLLAFGNRGVIGYWLHQWLGVQIAFTWWAAVLAAAVVSFPLMVRAIRIAFEGVDPKLEQAARSLGASRWDAFWTVTLPLARNGVIAGSVVAFARSLGEFGATIMFATNIPGKTQTIPLAIFSLFGRPGGFEASGRLVIISIVIAAGALWLSEYLYRRAGHHERA